MAGCVLLVLGGVALGAVVRPWPFVWCVCFPLAYAGVLGIWSETKSDDTGGSS